MVSSKQTPLIRIGRPGEVARFQAIDEAARWRYAAFPGFEFVAHAPAIAAERFSTGEIWAAEIDESVLGFTLIQSHGDNTTYLANISVAPDASGQGIGAMLLAHAITRTATIGAEAITLATFQTPPWNGPWFRRHGFVAMPESRIGPTLRAILDRHSRSLDMSTRETLWRPAGP
jgi:GNAT superfamily N-acetyltransferase